MPACSELIKQGDYVIIQRQKYTKLFKFSTADSIAALGKDHVELRNIESHPYFTTFKMIPRNARGRRLMTLEASVDVSSLKETINVTVTESGADNRNINADGASQTLKHDDIERLREAGSSASEIVGQIIENSKTFTSKTEYAQDKYVKRKEKKYFEYLQIRRPTIRMLTEIMYRQDPEKIYGLRMDSLSQLVSYSGVCGTGNYLLYESGTNGLAPATLLNAIGANTDAKLLHMHQGNISQRQALLALNLEEEQLDRCISVNIYSVLRHYYQTREVLIAAGTKRKIDDVIDDDKNGESNDGNGNSPAPKLVKNDNGNVVPNESLPSNNDDDDEDISEAIDMSEGISESQNSDESDDAIPSSDKETAALPGTPKWVYDNERGCELLRDHLDALVIVAREHPLSILKALLPFIKPSRPVVIFNLSREILMEVYGELKSMGQVTGLRLTSNWLRMYQILPNRTHPDVNMSGNSGFLLCGFTVR